jgi:steroid 5-alpha reductase family enzyme
MRIRGWGWVVIDLVTWLIALTCVLLLAFGGWLASLAKNDVSIVDNLWSLFFLLAACVYAGLAPATGPRTALLLVLVSIWALRLSGYLTWRNRGEPEDRRYQAIRARNQPGFAWKSLYLVFALQGALAWVIAAPLAAGIRGSAPLSALDWVGAGVWLFGFGFETIGDWQLARFKADAANRGRVMDRGLWRYTRHPNYFGEASLWWGFYLIALAAGGWWTLFAPLLMTALLLKVSGVALLEKDIAERRPAYRDYIARTNAFLPGPRRAPGKRASTAS